MRKVTKLVTSIDDNSNMTNNNTTTEKVMTDLETLQKVQLALVSGLVAVEAGKFQNAAFASLEQEIEEALDLLRPIIVKEMFTN